MFDSAINKILSFAAIALAVEIQIYRRHKQKHQIEPAEHRRSPKLLVLGKAVILLKRGYRGVVANVYSGIDRALGPTV